MKKLIVGVVVTCVLLVVPVTAAVRILRDKDSPAENQ